MQVRVKVSRDNSTPRRFGGIDWDAPGAVVADRPGFLVIKREGHQAWTGLATWESVPVAYDLFEYESVEECPNGHVFFGTLPRWSARFGRRRKAASAFLEDIRGANSPAEAAAVFAAHGGTE